MDVYQIIETGELVYPHGESDLYAKDTRLWWLKYSVHVGYRTISNCSWDSASVTLISIYSLCIIK